MWTAPAQAISRDVNNGLCANTRLAAKERWKDGCTACVVLVYNDDVYVAYIGDSGAALGSREKGILCTAASKARAWALTTCFGAKH
jgi:serine/threonine protein phosphatase PrpC